MKLDARSLVFYILGLAISVLPPVIATVSYFPLFIERGEGSVISGIALLLLLICAVPLFRVMKRLLESPSARTVWIIAFAVFFTLGRIADEMTVISFVGAVSNIIGSVLFSIAKRRRVSGDEEQA